MTSSTAESRPTPSPTASMSSSRGGSAATTLSARPRSSPNARRATRTRPRNTRTPRDTRRGKINPLSLSVTERNPIPRSTPSTGEPMPNRLRTRSITAVGFVVASLGVIGCAKKDQQAAVDTTASSTPTATMTDTSANRSLYDRLGGKSAMTAVVDTFVARVAADTRINKKFAKSNIPRVKTELVDQICAQTGGPCTYSGRTMKETHRNMKVTEGEFNALVEDLTASLNAFKVPSREQNELVTALGSMKGDIVEVKSTATGTPLPASFKPAPALGAAKQ